MPRFARVALTFVAFGLFFGSALVLGFLVAPLVFPFAFRNRDEKKEAGTRWVSRGYGVFLRSMRAIGLIGWNERPAIPGVKRGESYVMIANHPTLIDAVMLQSFDPKLSCVAKRSYYDSWIFKPVLSLTNYVRGGDLSSGDNTIAAVVQTLKDGHPVLMFPEGTRSGIKELKRFRRGGIEAAAQAGVPLVRLFISCSQRTLMKGRPIWDVPKGRIVYDWHFLPTLAPEDLSDTRAVLNATRDEYKERWQQAVQKYGLLEDGEPAPLELEAETLGPTSDSAT